MPWRLIKSLFVTVSPTPAEQLARAVMDRSILPYPYEAGWVADTLDARFEWSALHGVLLLRRLRQIALGGGVLAGEVSNALFSLYDYGLRETGVGDATIARKIRALGERFVGLGTALNAALLEADAIAAITDMLRRNAIASGHEKAVAHYLDNLAKSFSQVSEDALRDGADIIWPAFVVDPEKDPL